MKAKKPVLRAHFPSYWADCFQKQEASPIGGPAPDLIKFSPKVTQILVIYNLHSVCRCGDIIWSPHSCPPLGIRLPCPEPCA